MHWSADEDCTLPRHSLASGARKLCTLPRHSLASGARKLSWCVDVVVDDEPVVVSLSGGRAEGPTQAARALWLKTRPRLPGLWAAVAEQMRTWTASARRDPISPSDLAMTGIHLKPERFCEGGDLTVYFEVATDPDGSYYAPIRDDLPVGIHRDS
jgi:hypothetical protein